MKRKEKKGKKRKEAKRKMWCLGSDSGPSTHQANEALPLGHVEHSGNIIEILLLKPLSLY